MAEGKKYDGEKPRMYLLPPKALTEVAKVLTFGATKYDEHNWKKLDNLQNRYTGAALRHIFSHMDGEELDSETGLDHLAHAICCLLFKLEAKLDGEKCKEERSREFERFEYPESYTITFAGIADNEERSVRDAEYSVQYNTPRQDNIRILREEGVCKETQKPVAWSASFKFGDFGYSYRVPTWGEFFRDFKEHLS